LGGRAINDQLFSDLSALSNSRKSLSPEWKIIAKEQSDKGIDLVSQLYRDGYIFNPETNMFENKRTGKNITKYSYPGVRTTNFTPTMHFKTGGTLKRTIAHKFQTGGHFTDKAKGIWEYEDPEMQKKIMQGYKNNAWTDDAIKYLTDHQDLKNYLANAYKTLSPNLQYFTPDRKAHDTYNGQWARISKVSRTTGHFADKMKAAGYEYDKATGAYRNQDGTRVFNVDENGNLYRKDDEGAGTIKNSLEFDPNTNAIMWRSNATTPGTYNYSKDKNKALNNKLSKYWAKIGERLGLKGKFYDSMLKAGYHFDPKSGQYKNAEGVAIASANQGKNICIIANGSKRGISDDDFSKRILKIK
jgi:hypothetical protein